MHYFLYAIESWQGGVFSVRSYCVQEQRQVPLCFPPASATVSLHNLQLETEHSVSNFLIPPKFGYHGLAADSTLALCTLMAAAVGCTKNGQPCRRSSKSSRERTVHHYPCRFKVPTLKRPQSTFADWYSKDRRQRESRAKACPRFALALSPSLAEAEHHIQNQN